MGYFTRQLAKESISPARFSLAANPNFIQFESLNEGGLSGYMMKKLIVSQTQTEQSGNDILATEVQTGIEHRFSGTYNRQEVNSTTFFIDTDAGNTAENIKACFMADSFFRSNYSIYIPVAKNDNGEIINGNIIEMYSNKPGSRFYFTLDEVPGYVVVEQNLPGTSEPDTIDEDGTGDIQIELEFYISTGIFAGRDDTPQLNGLFGTFLMEVSKAYAGAPVWFDINAVTKNGMETATGAIFSDNWSDTGTLTDMRFIARRNNGINRTTFYISDVLYIVNGYSRNLEENDLSEYVFNPEKNNTVKLLTKQPVLPHCEGQAHFLNFLFADPLQDNNEYDIGIFYKIYTQSKKHIADVVTDEQKRTSFLIANTIKLRIDEVIKNYPGAGIVEAYLCCNRNIVSQPLCFRIQPAYMHPVHDFAFLNALGGWSSFNFPGIPDFSFNTSATTIYKTQIPSYDTGSRLESVFGKDASESFTVKSLPVNDTVCDWLKELACSAVVFELSTGRYIIIDQLEIKCTSNEELYIPEMIYHYSDSYNTIIT